MYANDKASFNYPGVRQMLESVLFQHYGVNGVILSFFLSLTMWSIHLNCGPMFAVELQRGCHFEITLDFR